MRQPYNSGRFDLGFSDYGRNLGIYLFIAALVFGAIGCRKTAGEGVPTPPAPPVAADPKAQADDFYAQRADVMKVRQAVIVLRQAFTANPADYEIAWRAARANYYLGTHSPDDTETERAFREGTEAGKAAVKLNAARPEGHFWLGANYGGNAEISTLASLTDIEDIKREMEAVLKIDEGFEAGSAYMALGQVYLKAPRIFGGDVQKAIDYLQKGLKVGDNNGLLHLRLAEAYAEQHRNEDARQQLKILFEKKATPGYEPEYNDAIKEGHELEAKLKQP
jgi:predicted Zn-dependent protease